MICTISSRTSPRPPGNWCEARSVVGAAAAVAEIAASAVASAARWNAFMSILLLKVAAILKLYHPGSTQPFDLGGVLAEHGAQDLLGVLAEHRRCEAVFHRRGRETHRARDERQLAGRRMIQLDLHAARLHLGFLEHLRDVVDRPVRHARVLEQLEPLALRLFPEYIAEQARQLVAIFDPLAVRGEARILGELAAAGCF